MRPQVRPTLSGDSLEMLSCGKSLKGASQPQRKAGTGSHRRFRATCQPIWRVASAVMWTAHASRTDIALSQQATIPRDRTPFPGACRPAYNIPCSVIRAAEDPLLSALIELNDLSRWYGSFHALRGITLRLPPGRIGLLGPNGAGKSSLLKILLGLLPPSSGSGRFLRHDLGREGESLRQAVGYMPEAESLIPGLRGAEYVALAGELYGMPRIEAQRRAHELLTYLGLEDARYRYLEEYSTGMKQRIKLAQALVHDPPVLLLDEPTSGLDPSGREAMLNLLLSLGTDYGKSMLLCTHLLGDVERVCETVVILNKGQVVRQGSVAELRTRRQDRYRLRVQG